MTWRPTSVFMLFSKPEDEVGEESARFSGINTVKLGIAIPVSILERLIDIPLPSDTCKPSRMGCDEIPAMVVLQSPRAQPSFFPNQAAIRDGVNADSRGIKQIDRSMNIEEKSQSCR